MQPDLLASVLAPRLDRWRIVEADAASAAEHAPGARLVHTDPPWAYDHTALKGSIVGHYEGLPMSAIAAHLTAAFDAAAPDAYMLCWTTWPMLAAWLASSASMPWRYVTGGSWHKVGRLGIGFHVRGDSEPWLLYVKGKPRPHGPLSNAFAEERRAHSEKPTAFLRAAIEAFTEPEDLVLDIYAGRGPCGVAARLAGRRYVGIEIDPARAEIARANIAQGATDG